MRYYSVPFSTEGEERIAFNLSAREVLIMAMGITAGVIVAKIASFLLDTFLLYCIPLGLPFVGLAALLAFVKTNKSGCVMTLENYIIRLINFRQKPRHYVKERQVF